MGVRFIAINDGYDSQNHDAQTDSLIIPFKNLINDAYCADTSRKIRSQFEVKRQKGDYIAPFAAFGYLKDPNNKNQLIVDEYAAAVVRDIFNWKVHGMNQQGIADRLNDTGILSPFEYKKAIGLNYATSFHTNPTAKWTPVAVGRILKDELYIGVLAQGKSSTPNYKVKQRIIRDKEDWVRVEQSHEAIISKEDFDLVSILMKKDTRTAPGVKSLYLFSGMLQCANCKQNLVRKNVCDRGNKHVYHICSTYKKGRGCTGHIISDKALYSSIFDTLRLHINECARLSSILELIDNRTINQHDAEKMKKQISEKHVEVEKLNGRKVKLYEDLCDGIINEDEYTNFRSFYNTQITETENVLKKLVQELDNILNNRTENCLWIEHFKQYQGIESLTRNIIVELIEKITVYKGGKIEISFRYQSKFDNALHYIDTYPTDTLDKEEVVD